MSKRKLLEKWQGIADEDFIQMGLSFVKSPAYKALSAKRRDLLHFAIERHGKTAYRKRTSAEYFPYDKYGDGVGVRNDDFYLNKALLVAEGLYSSNDARSIYDDLSVLCDMGFLIKVNIGRTSTKQKDIYRISDKWKGIDKNAAKEIKKRYAVKRKARENEI